MKINKKIISLFFSAFFLGLTVAPAALAVECDQDGDGFVVIPTQIMRNINADMPYVENGNYSASEWKNYFDIYKGADLTEEEVCNDINFKKGAEAKRCDSVVIGANSNVYDSSKITPPISGSKIYPGALDVADNGIDEDCSGKDSTLLPEAGDDKDLGGLADKVVGLLSKLVVVVSIIIMIWGGVLYATAAGNEVKTSKARKAIIGAIIGLAVGLLAPTVVNWIAANLV